VGEVQLSFFLFPGRSLERTGGVFPLFFFPFRSKEIPQNWIPFGPPFFFPRFPHAGMNPPLFSLFFPGCSENWELSSLSSLSPFFFFFFLGGGERKMCFPFSFFSLPPEKPREKRCSFLFSLSFFQKRVPMMARIPFLLFFFFFFSFSLYENLAGGRRHPGLLLSLFFPLSPQGGRDSYDPFFFPPLPYMRELRGRDTSDFPFLFFFFFSFFFQHFGAKLERGRFPEVVSFFPPLFPLFPFIGKKLGRYFPPLCVSRGIRGVSFFLSPSRRRSNSPLSLLFSPTQVKKQGSLSFLLPPPPIDGNLQLMFLVFFSFSSPFFSLWWPKAFMAGRLFFFSLSSLPSSISNPHRNGCFLSPLPSPPSFFLFFWWRSCTYTGSFFPSFSSSPPPSLPRGFVALARFFGFSPSFLFFSAETWEKKRSVPSFFFFFFLPSFVD